MKKMISFSFKKLLTIALPILLSACESCNLFGSEPNSELGKLPPATMEGKSTFGCLVNGKAWVIQTSTDALADYQSGSLQISAEIVKQNSEQGITFVLLSGVVEGLSYDLSNDPQYEAKFGTRTLSSLCFYDDENTINGTLTITKLDQTKLIVSGLFEFTTVVIDCDTIRVTDGRFDLLYAN